MLLARFSFLDTLQQTLEGGFGRSLLDKGPLLCDKDAGTGGSMLSIQREDLEARESNLIS